MAKTTLNFQNNPSYNDSSATVSTQVNASDTLWYGDYVSINFQSGQKLEITDFGDVDEVVVVLKSDNIDDVDAGTIVTRLTPASPIMEEATVTVDNSSVSIGSAAFYLAVKNANKGKTIGYNIIGAPTTASSASQDQDGDTILYAEDTTLSVDSTTLDTPVELNKGDKIVLVPSESPSVTTYFLIYKGATYTGGGTLVQMRESGYTAESDDELVMIVAGEIYTEGFTCQYRVIRAHESAAANTVISGSEYYTTEDANFTLVHFHKLKNTSSNDIIIIEGGRVIATLGENDEFVSSNDLDITLASATSGTSLSYRVTLPPPTEYSVTYSGGSGIVQIKKYNAHDWVRVYGNAGLDYMLIGEPEGDGNDVMFYLNMTGFNSVKIVCRGEVMDACINKVGSAYSDNMVGTI